MINIHLYTTYNICRVGSVGVFVILMLCVNVCRQGHQCVQFFTAERAPPEGVGFIELFAEVLDVWPFAHYPLPVRGSRQDQYSAQWDSPGLGLIIDVYHFFVDFVCGRCFYIIVTVYWGCLWCSGVIAPYSICPSAACVALQELRSDGLQEFLARVGREPGGTLGFLIVAFGRP